MIARYGHGLRRRCAGSGDVSYYGILTVAEVASVILMPVLGGGCNVVFFVMPKDSFCFFSGNGLVALPSAPPSAGKSEKRRKKTKTVPFYKQTAAVMRAKPPSTGHGRFSENSHGPTCAFTHTNTYLWRTRVPIRTTAVSTWRSQQDCVRGYQHRHHRCIALRAVSFPASTYERVACGVSGTTEPRVAKRDDVGRAGTEERARKIRKILNALRSRPTNARRQNTRYQRPIAR